MKLQYRHLKLQLFLTFFYMALNAHIASAQTDISKTFGNYTVYYSVFNSTFLTPEIASAYGFTRANDQALVNISLIESTETGSTLGLAANVSGNARNLIGQSTTLNFVEINEGNATYYLAAFTFADQDPLNFNIRVQHDNSRTPHEVSFTRTLYVD